jgi:hypothetical protein
LPASGKRSYASREHMKGSLIAEEPSDERGGGSPVTNFSALLTRPAACPRTTVLSSRGLVPLTAVGYASPEAGRERASGVEKRVEQHVFAKSAAVQVNDQVKDTGIRMPKGPHPWRPPE